MDYHMNTLEKDCSLYGVFQQIINDLKNSSPLWEDFVARANKLYVCLRTTLQAISAYLDAFQRIADVATNSKGSTKDIGTALTRICLRHKSVEARMKTFTQSLMDSLILPLQEKLEEWKRQVVVIDKEHTKEYKRCRSEIKKRSTDTLRLKKKAKKNMQSETIQNMVDSSMQDIELRRSELEDVERKSLRTAMVEERIRYCTFVNLLQPVVREECDMLSELEHLQEAMDSIALVTKDPHVLPDASEEFILQSKTSFNFYSDSPSGGNSIYGYTNSLGSRKSSVCSISSINSSGSSGSPSHHYQRSISQLLSPAIRLRPGESSDSGFSSSPALISQANNVPNNTVQTNSTWPTHLQDEMANAGRPHTISTAYEKGHQRPPLTVYTFQNPENESPKNTVNLSARPPLPIRCSSLERPINSQNEMRNTTDEQKNCTVPTGSYLEQDSKQGHPTYVNMSELALMANTKNMSQHHPVTTVGQNAGGITSPVLSTTSSIISSDSSATNQPSTSPDGSGDTDTPVADPVINFKQESEQFDKTPTATSDFYPTSRKPTSSDQTDHYATKEEVRGNGSVFDKKSMFEKLEQQQHQINSLLGRSDHLANRKAEEIYKATGTLNDTKVQGYEDSIQELVNLIGELDSFQREHESKERDQALVNGHDSNSSNTRINLAEANDLHRVRDDESDDNRSREMNIVLKNDQMPTVSEQYARDNAEIVVLRRKNSTNDLNNSLTKLDELPENVKKLSSFKNDSSSLNGSARNTLTDVDDKFNGLVQLPPVKVISELVNPYKSPTKGKPIIQPRPTSLSGVSRLTRRTSVNAPKPPPPVRRSSSVTPSSNSNQTGMIGSPLTLSQQNIMSTSSESLPPPPSYLLDSHNAGQSVAGTSSKNVAETVKVLTELRHMPASPNTLRRIHNQSPQQTANNQVNQYPSPPQHRIINEVNNSPQSIPPTTQIYSPSKQMNKVSSFRTTPPTKAPNQPQQSPSLLAQLSSKFNIGGKTHSSQTASTKSNGNSKSSNCNNSPEISAPIQNDYIYGVNKKPNSIKDKTDSNNLMQMNAQLLQQYQQQQQQQQQQHQMHHHQSQQQHQHQQHQQLQQQSQHRVQHSVYQNEVHNDVNKVPQHHYYSLQRPDGKNNQFYKSLAQVQHHHPTHLNRQQYPQQHQKIYVSTNPFVTSHSALCSTSSNPTQNLILGRDRTPNHYGAMQSPNSNNAARSKVKTSYTTDQRLSGKACAVRNLINSKALKRNEIVSQIPVPTEPDPRVCHESLMDQIRKGATLKRNRTINDRSAPKIQ